MVGSRKGVCEMWKEAWLRTTTQEEGSRMAEELRQ